MKRILDEDQDSSDDDKPKVKMAKPEKPTDILSSSNAKASSTSTQGKAGWQKSIGSMVTTKKNLLVKPKNTVKPKPVLVASSLVANYSDSDESD